LSDQVPRLNHFVGNHLPIIVFGPLILFALSVGILRRRVRAAEVAVVLALAVVACNLPGSGLLRFFSRNVVMPTKYNLEPAWQEMNAWKYTPKCLLVNGGEYDEESFRGYFSGWGEQGQPISLRRVPWRTWREPLMLWLPLVALVALGSMCMALMVHRAWSQRERLPYPIARLANTLLEDDGRGGIAPVLRNRLCLLGAALVLGIHIVNGLYVWSEGRSIGIPTVFNFSAVARQFPYLQRGRWVQLNYVPLYPTAIAFAYFVASDVSLALGLSPLALSLFTSALFAAGANITFSSIDGGYLPWQHAGSYFAMTLMVIYLGRRFYWQMFRGALLLRRGNQVRGYEVWACRGFLLCMLSMILLLAAVGLDWPLAILTVLMIMLGFLVMARMNAEAGLILSEVAWQPIAVFLGLFGAKALGLEAFAIVGMLGVQFTLNRRECLMPLFINALRICDVQKVSSARIGAASATVFVVAMAAAVVFGLWVDYNYGVHGGEEWPWQGAPRKAFDRMASYHNRLRIDGDLAASENMSPLKRLGNMEPDSNCLIWLGVGGGLVLTFYALRLRLPWWPVHPIIFLFWGTWAMREFAWSFLLGWLIKRLLTRFGAPQRRVRTFMIGVIVGELLGGILWMIVGAIYYALTNLTPPRYHVFPGG
jgi:hypothetical protein